MRTLLKIQLLLTVLVAAELIVTIQFASRLKGIAISGHSSWDGFGAVADIVWQLTFFSWLIVTIVLLPVLLARLGARVFSKPEDRQAQETNDTAEPDGAGNSHRAGQ